MGDEAEGTGQVGNTSKAKQGSVTATFEGQMTPQNREKLIAGVKKLAKECNVEVSIG